MKGILYVPIRKEYRAIRWVCLADLLEETGKVGTQMHGNWCQRFIGTGADIRSRREISEVVTEEGMGEGGIIARRRRRGVIYHLVTAVFLGETGKVVDAKMRAK